MSGKTSCLPMVKITLSEWHTNGKAVHVYKISAWLGYRFNIFGCNQYSNCDPDSVQVSWQWRVAERSDVEADLEAVLTTVRRQADGSKYHNRAELLNWERDRERQRARGQCEN
ncbi:hypothetical protein RRG08_011486 [Elysia crispata]|uniref:Uncharacterized protein n=1 Tax=Elysia crispata TaxID=231223 RepID=A0AAE1B877_9GAST|nr:hypothetical protein RRG08_011486 [Elysia crispata]